jgi:hypothetical protein
MKQIIVHGGALNKVNPFLFPCQLMTSKTSPGFCSPAAFSAYLTINPLGKTLLNLFKCYA